MSVVDFLLLFNSIDHGANWLNFLVKIFGLKMWRNAELLWICNNGIFLLFYTTSMEINIWYRRIKMQFTHFHSRRIRIYRSTWTGFYIASYRNKRSVHNTLENRLFAPRSW